MTSDVSDACMSDDVVVNDFVSNAVASVVVVGCIDIDVAFSVIDS